MPRGKIQCLPVKGSAEEQKKVFMQPALRIIMKAIIIYCSLTGRTKLVAEIIAGELSNYEVEVEPIIYTKGKRPNYKEEEEK